MQFTDFFLLVLLHLWDNMLNVGNNISRKEKYSGDNKLTKYLIIDAGNTFC